jgi:hypothetical protein
LKDDHSIQKPVEPEDDGEIVLWDDVLVEESDEETVVRVTRTHQKTMKKRLKVIGGERRRFKEIWWRDTSTRELHLSHMNEHCGGGGNKRRSTGLCGGNGEH